MSEPDTAPRLSEARITAWKAAVYAYADGFGTVGALMQCGADLADEVVALKVELVDERRQAHEILQERIALKAERDTLSEAWTEAREIAGRSIAKRLEAEAERDTLLKAARDCPTHGDPLVCLACEADEQALPVWQRPRRVMPPRLRGEPERVGEDRLRHQAICISEMLRHAGVGSGTLTEGVQELSRRTEAATGALLALRAQVEQFATWCDENRGMHGSEFLAKRLRDLLASQPGPATQEPNP